MKLCLLMVLALFVGCLANKKNLNTMNSKPLEEKLIEIGYLGLFLHGSRSLVDSIWQNGNIRPKIERIIESASSSLHGKFLAAEVLSHFEVELDTQSYGVLAEAYAYALERTSADRENRVQLNGNLWGLLYEENDTGYLGKQFIKFGNAAIPPLTKLLDDNAGRILYEGSQEATLGNAYQYRIKDFAAFYISKIKKIPIKFYQDFEKRDKEIERLKDLFREN